MFVLFLEFVLIYSCGDEIWNETLKKSASFLFREKGMKLKYHSSPSEEKFDKERLIECESKSTSSALLTSSEVNNTSIQQRSKKHFNDVNCNQIG